MASDSLLRLLGFRTVLLASIAGGGLCFGLFAQLTAETPVPMIFVLLLISGALRSIGFTTYNSLQFADVEPERMSSANTLSATTAQLANGMGVAVGALGLRLTDTATEHLPGSWFRSGAPS